MLARQPVAMVTAANYPRIASVKQPSTAGWRLVAAGQLAEGAGEGDGSETGESPPDDLGPDGKAAGVSRWCHGGRQTRQVCTFDRDFVRFRGVRTVTPPE